MKTKIASRTSGRAVFAVGSIALLTILLAGGALATKNESKPAESPTPAPNAPTASPAPAPAAPAAAKPSPPPGPVEPEAMTKLDFSGLNDDQKKMAVSLLNEHSCDCGCGMKLAVCRRDDPKCSRSTALGTQV